MIIDGQRSSDRVVGAVLAYCKAFNDGDWEHMLEQLTDDVAHDINQGGREIGKDQFRKFLHRMERCYKEQMRDIIVMGSPDGRRAAAEFLVHGTYLSTDEGLPKATGQTYVLPSGTFFELRGGRICRVSNYYNLKDWLHQIEPLEPGR